VIWARAGAVTAVGVGPSVRATGRLVLPKLQFAISNVAEKLNVMRTKMILMLSSTLTLAVMTRTVRCWVSTAIPTTILASK